MLLKFVINFGLTCKFLNKIISIIIKFLKAEYEKKV